MGVWDSLLTFFGQGGAAARPLVPARLLDVPTGDNYRDLGGYPTAAGGVTRYQRFVRSGSTGHLTTSDLERLEAYGVRHVLDLRSAFEEPRLTDRFARRPGVSWKNVPLFDYDLSDPALVATQAPAGNYLIDGYVTMLSNRAAIRQIFDFFGEVGEGEAVLFHCAAGMDRTGITAMLVLGLADVPRSSVVADYLYSFAPVEEVDRVVFGGEAPQLIPGSWNPLPSRREAIEFCYDRVVEGYGTFRAYLAACGVSEVCLDRVRGTLVES